MAKIKILKILTAGSVKRVVYLEDKKAKQKNYLSSISDEAIKADILGTVATIPAENKPKVQSQLPPQVTTPPEIDKKTERIRMIKELNSAGINGMQTSGYDAVLTKYNRAKSEGKI